MPNDSSRKAPVQETPVNLPQTPQATFDNKQFEDFIGNKGYEVNIERAVKCPCMVSATQSSMSGCMNCGGTGWFFIDLQTTVVLCSGMGAKYKFEAWSENNAGTVNISAKAADRLGFMDKLTLKDVEAWYSQVRDVKRSNTGVPFFFTTYKPIEVFELYFWVDLEQPLVFVPEDKYTISGNKIMIDEAFYTAHLATTGMQKATASIRYTHNPVFHILDVNREMIKLHDIDQPADGPKIMFPISCIGRRAQFIFDAPNFSGDKLFDNTNYGRAAINYGKS